MPFSWGFIRIFLVLIMVCFFCYCSLCFIIQWLPLKSHSLARGWLFYTQHKTTEIKNSCHIGHRCRECILWKKGFCKLIFLFIFNQLGFENFFFPWYSWNRNILAYSAKAKVFNCYSLKIYFKNIKLLRWKT